jgi:hypothetical protein
MDRESPLPIPDTRPDVDVNEDGVDRTLIRWMLTLTPDGELYRPRVEKQDNGEHVIEGLYPPPAYEA